MPGEGKIPSESPRPKPRPSPGGDGRGDSARSRGGGPPTPLPTRYRGCRFRSRLEARWAVFFDALEIKWEYEPEGFKLESGECYLPDFFLRTFDGNCYTRETDGMYVEVKPDGGDFSKAIRFSREVRRKMWLAEGVPDFRAYRVVGYPNEEHLGEHAGFGIPNADSAYGENRMFTNPGYEREDGTIPEEYHDLLGEHYKRAVDAARGARFDRGDD